VHLHSAGECSSCRTRPVGCCFGYKYSCCIGGHGPVAEHFNARHGKAGGQVSPKIVATIWGVNLVGQDTSHKDAKESTHLAGQYAAEKVGYGDVDANVASIS
jgi:hypothetical protein